MISFFPTPYEDEILYSIINRYHMRSGNISYSDTIKDLYNNRYIKSILDLPTNNESLLHNINRNLGLDLFISKVTLIGYYTAFLGDKEKERIFDMLSNNKAKGVHSLVGASQRISKYDGYMKICPKCYQEEKEQIGEPYLHRIHQIPAVFVCKKHRIPLQRSKVPFSFYSNRFIQLDQIDFIEFNENKIIQDNLQKFISIKEDCEFILNNEVSNKEIEWFSNQYKNRLRQLNLCTPKGVVNINQVKSRFVDFYGKDMLSLFELDTFNEYGTNWIKYIIRNKKYVLNPLKHIMFIKFLGIGIRDIFNKKIEYKPFGDGPWPCMNKICDNYRKKVIDDVEISYNSKKKSPVGKFKCDCGYTYSRVGPDKSEEDLYRIGKVIEMGSLWEDRLEGLIIRKASLNYIERALETSQRTIKKYAIRLGYTDYVKKRCKVGKITILEEKKAKKELDKKLKINEYRETWLNLRTENPKYTITKLREMNIAAQDYLYRHDREWLYKNYPEKSKRTEANQLVNWKKRDLDILEKVKVAVVEIENEIGRPKKITITWIAKKIKMESLLLNNIDRLPKTKEFINEVVDINKSY